MNCSIGASTSRTYRSRLAANHSRLLWRFRFRRNVNARGVKYAANVLRSLQVQLFSQRLRYSSAVPRPLFVVSVFFLIAASLPPRGQPAAADARARQVLGAPKFHEAMAVVDRTHDRIMDET